MRIFNRARRKKRNVKRWRATVRFIAAVLVFATTYALILPAITIDEDSAASDPGITLSQSVEEDKAAEEKKAEEAKKAEEEKKAKEAEEAKKAEEERKAEEEQKAKEAEEAQQEEEDAESDKDESEQKSDEEQNSSEQAEQQEPKESMPEEQGAEQESEEPQVLLSAPMPAVNFEEETDDTNKADRVKVTVIAPEGAFPEGTTMQVEKVKEKEVKDAVVKAVDENTPEDKKEEVVRIQAVNITFLDPEGNEIQPQKEIKVTMSSDLVKETKEPVLVHIDDKGKGEVVDQMTEKQVEKFESERDKALDEKEIAFQTDAFSVYAIVGTETLTTRYITADGQTYSITVTYGPDAQIPSDATLSVREITKGTDEYFVYYNKALKAAGLVLTDPKTIDETALSTESTVEVHEMIPFMPDARFFDVSIMVDGSEFEPKAEVEVKVEYDESLAMSSNDKVSAVHFSDDGDELLDAQVSENADKQVVTHSQDGFSVTGDVVISMRGDADPNDPKSITAEFGALRAGEQNAGPRTVKTVTNNGDGTYNLNYSPKPVNWHNPPDSSGVCAKI